jgi:hypothetical protein
MAYKAQHAAPAPPDDGPGSVRRALAFGADSAGTGSRSVGTPLGDAPLIPITLIMIGGYLAWFAVHYWESDVAWPTDPIKALATGKGLPAQSAGQASYDSTVDALFTQQSGGGPTGSTGSTPTTPPAPGGTVTVPAGDLSHAQLEALWVSSGGDPAVKNKAAAIAQAESGGSRTVTSGNPDGGTNVGLWQLDTPGGKGAGHTIAQLQNAQTNAQVAIMGSANGSNWSAWATAVGNNPAYLRYMGSS